MITRVTERFRKLSRVFVESEVWFKLIFSVLSRRGGGGGGGGKEGEGSPPKSLFTAIAGRTNNEGTARSLSLYHTNGLSDASSFSP